MILFQKKFVVAVDSMNEAERVANELMQENPGSEICDVRKKIVKNKNVEYVHCEIVLELFSEQDYKKTGEIN